jgi:mono/diheme cytochrome c family protein
MKKLVVIAFISGAVAITGCGDKVKREPGRVYMPDMMYSRAYETYSITEDQRKAMEKQGIYFTGNPVPGTVKRGGDFSFRIAKDSIAGDSTRYLASSQVRNPIVSMDTAALKEAERLYLIHCGICHGTALDGDGPLHKGGEGPFVARPSNLITSALSDGQMFYVVTYGRNLMGSYASQLNSSERWQVISYIRSKQKGGGPAKPGTVADAASSAGATTAAAQADSTAKPK